VNGTFRYAVTPGYLETMRIPLRKGRLLGAQDRGGAPRAALISESLARRRLPGRDPIGQQIQVGAADGPLFTVVGVVADVRQLSLAVADADAVYIPDTQWHFADNTMSTGFERRGAPASSGPARDLSVMRIRPSCGSRRWMPAFGHRGGATFVLILFEAVRPGGAGAVRGIRVLAGSVRSGLRNRRALGTWRYPRDILGMVVGQGMTLTAVGVSIGIAGAVGATQALAAMLFDISRLDPVTYLAVTGVLVLTAIAASGVPAWRAVRVDPATTLRSD
jgi:hypothetical protein